MRAACASLFGTIRRRIEDVAIARAREVLGLLQGRDRDAAAHRWSRCARHRRISRFSDAARSATPSVAQRARIAAQFRSSRSRSSTRRGVSSASKEFCPVGEHHASSRSGRSEVSMKSGVAPSCAGQPHAIVPVDRHADALGARHVGSRARHEQRARGRGAELRQHRPIGLRPRLVEARLFGRDDRRERDAAARRGAPAERDRAVGRDAERHAVRASPRTATVSGHGGSSSQRRTSSSAQCTPTPDCSAAARTMPRRDGRRPAGT